MIQKPWLQFGRGRVEFNKSGLMLLFMRPAGNALFLDVFNMPTVSVGRDEGMHFT